MPEESGPNSISLVITGPDQSLYPINLDDRIDGAIDDAVDPLQGRIAAIEALQRKLAIQNRVAARSSLSRAGIPDLLSSHQQSLAVPGSPTSSASPSPSPVPVNDLTGATAALKARLPIAQYSQTKLTAVDAFVAALWNGGVWQKLTRLFINVAPSSTAALTCWKSGVLMSGGSAVLMPWQYMEAPSGSILSCAISGLNPLDFHFFGKVEEHQLPATPTTIDWSQRFSVGSMVQLGDWISTGYSLDTVGLKYWTYYDTWHDSTKYMYTPAMRQSSAAVDIAMPPSLCISQDRQNFVRLHTPSPVNFAVPVINETDMNAPRTQFRIHGRTNRRWFASSMGTALTDAEGALLLQRVETLITALRG